MKRLSLKEEKFRVYVTREEIESKILNLKTYINDLHVSWFSSKRTPKRSTELIESATGLLKKWELFQKDMQEHYAHAIVFVLDKNRKLLKIFYI